MPTRHSLLCLLLMLIPTLHAAEEPPATVRTAANDAELRYWLENMVWHHRFSTDEIRSVTGLSDTHITGALKKFNLQPETKPQRAAYAPLLVLPYPGGRHPRIGFLEGAINPQRETKVSVFTPWDDKSYVVVDVPEALWSSLGLTYLAHTHIPTIWDKQKIQLEPLEWNRRENGSFDIERKLPNGIVFNVQIVPGRDGVRMKMTLKNGSQEPLSDLRVQNCVMLKGAVGFNKQTNDNKVFQSPYVACRSETGDHWVITAWQPCHRPWGNVACPCLHSDPKFPDCPPGETRTLLGWLSFYTGPDIQKELSRLDGVAWERKKR